MSPISRRCILISSKERRCFSIVMETKLLSVSLKFKANSQFSSSIREYRGDKEMMVYGEVTREAIKDFILSCGIEIFDIVEELKNGNKIH